MTWIVGFFKWLWNAIKSLFSFVTSVPTLIMGSISVIFGSVGTLKTTISSGTSYVNTVGEMGTASAQAFQQFSQNLHDFFKIGVYALSLDVAFDVLLNCVTIFLTIAVSIVVFFFLTLPAFVIQYYAIKGTLKIACSFIPPMWVPSALSGWINSKTHISDFFGGSVADHAKHWYEGKWIQ